MSAMDQAIAEGKRVSHEVWTAASPEQQAALRAKLGIEVKDGKPQRRTDSKRQAAPKAQRNTAKASPKATGDPRVAAAIVALEAVVKVLKSI